MSTEPVLSLPADLAPLANATLLRETARQIAKDLQLVEAAAAEITDYRSFFVLVVNTLEHLMHHQPEKLRQMLYTIDLNEALAQEALAKGPHALAELVIKRALQKVVLRKRFS